MPKGKAKKTAHQQNTSVVHRIAPLDHPALPYLALLVAVLVGILAMHVRLTQRFHAYADRVADRLMNLETISARSLTTPIAYGVPQRVARVIDGDTVLLENGEQLRYLGADAPEVTSEQCYSTEATLRNRELVEGEEISFYRDISERDQFGRILGYVYLADGTFVNETLIREGYAFAYTYPPDVSQHVFLKRSEDTAHESGLGLWGGCGAASVDGRMQTTHF